MKYMSHSNWIETLMQYLQSTWFYFLVILCRLCYWTHIPMRTCTSYDFNDKLFFCIIYRCACYILSTLMKQAPCLWASLKFITNGVFAVCHQPVQAKACWLSAENYSQRMPNVECNPQIIFQATYRCFNRPLYERSRDDVQVSAL